MATIACRDLDFTYPNGVIALQAIDLAVASGEFVSLIGPSGCGKSTLLRVVADLLPPESGLVSIADQPPSRARRDRRIAMVFQEPALLGWRKAARNVELPLELAGKRDAAARARARELLAVVGLGDMAERLPAHMSGGQRQRVAIARALMQEPAVLLMDEPFGALDQITRDEMNDELLKVWENTRITVLFVTHSIAEAVYLSDKVAVFTPRPGRLRAVIDIPLARPRLRAVRRDPVFFNLENQVLAALEGVDSGTQNGAASEGRR
jgi:NitT/TauT family transport system ATP-binding protein